ncbi:GGDEF domain-containing protein [Acutalibacter sp. 1XD8-33]|uniref:GGDEF domain-containing protein n=1 Tax=Acutalibacter sp. 1XD8-33 TaxID=2320081 RepID=UPI000EA2E7B6|nr:GGDEF domain-containing protein [Acutalibacter sp. 1XD8-33]RKJ42119.1 GGDEF domain-containing protein [Acutalibacter sp. 1XD8-33]
MEKTPARKKAHVKGIKVRTVNFIMIFLSCLLYTMLLAVTYRASQNYQAMVTATNLYIQCQENASMLSEASDYLTDQARMFAVTMDPAHMENYFEEVHVTRRRKRALISLTDQASSEALEYMEKALENSNRLMEQEIYSMRLVAEAQSMDPASLPQEVADTQIFPGHQRLSPEEQLEAAREKVFGSEYQAKKQLITSNISYFLSDVMASTQQGQQSSMDDLARSMAMERILFSILFLMNISIFLMIILLIVKPLQIYVNCIKKEKRMEITGAYEFKYLALTYNDIYEINAANEILLRHQAEHDSLTGLINRGAFEHVRQVLKVKSQALALLIIDVDKFKLINDGYGHETGDLVLKKVARLLEESFRSTDYPARIGGDEFAVILPDIDCKHQPMVEAKIRSINDTLLAPTDGAPPVSLSVGGAFSSCGFSDSLYAQADAALYAAKENGRCGCRFYEEGIPTPAEKASKE